jgi:quinoprotein glucose dehydrogenase
MTKTRTLVCVAALAAGASLIALAQGRGVAQGASAQAVVAAQIGPNWDTYGGNLASHRYAPLDQINKDNFKNLAVAWRLKTDFLGPTPDNLYSATPLYVNGVLYTTAGTRRAAIALNPETGEMLWMHSEDEGPRGLAAPRRGAGRGLAYWSSADGADQRILYVTPGYRMIALNAKTGEVIRSFGQDGVVDLKMDNDQEYDLITAAIGLNATPLVAGDVVVVGAAHPAAGSPNTRPTAKGFVRGFDVKTGKRLWTFHTIPTKGEFGYDTWLDGSAEKNGNLGVWAQMSADLELGLVYVPTEMPATDYYGVNRPGDGLFGESIVALDLKTGKRKWHYQTVRHGLWDWDLPCAPMLYDVQIGGRTIKALAQPTKSAFLFVLNRETGEPIWPIEDRPVPQSNVPGEKTSATQPFPTRPLPFDRQGVTTDDLIDFTPALRAQAIEQAKAYRMGPIFTPPALATPDGPIATLMLPAEVGGANWPGGSFDPETNRLYIHSHTNVFALPNVQPELSVPGPTNLAGTLRGAQEGAAAAGGRGGRGGAGGAGARGGAPGGGAAPAGGAAPVAGARGGAPGGGAAPAGGAAPVAGARGGAPGGGAAPAGGAAPVAGARAGAPAGAPAAGRGGGGRGGTTVQGLPLIKPPYDRITAYDMNTGNILWQKTHSSTPDNIKNNAALKGLDLPRLGQPGRTFIGVLTTKTLVIAGEGGVHTNAQGQTVALLRAYDKATGEDVPGEVNMPARQTGSPMSYLHNGKQYIVIAVTGQGANTGGEIIAYALP